MQFVPMCSSRESLWGLGIAAPHTLNSIIKERKRMKILSVYAAAIIAAAIATPASAQEIGTYTGTSADGQGLTFEVGTDPNNGDPQLINATIFFSAPCKNNSYVLDTGWGFGLSNDIVKRKVKFVTSDNYFTFTVDLTFATDGQTATGTIESVAPTLYKVGAHPKEALICTSPSQALSLTLQPAGSVTSKPNQQSVRPNVKTQDASADEVND